MRRASGGPPSAPPPLAARAPAPAAFLAALALLLALWPLGAPATAIPNPGDSVLLIYVNDAAAPNDGDDIAMFQNVAQALGPGGGLAFPAAITPLELRTTDSGIAGELAAHGLSLSQFCQVWDLRFLQSQGVVQSADTITGPVTTPGSDMALYQSFLEQGGHLFLVGDNAGFPDRNDGMNQFLADVSGGPVAFPVTAVTYSYPVADFSNAAPWNFATVPNVLSGIFANFAFTTYPGLVPTAGMGSGVPLLSDGTNAAFWLWPAGSLPGDGSGMIAAAYDTNWLYTAPLPTGWQQVAQNLYAVLSTCYAYSVTKSVSPASIPIGGTALYTLCYSNTGARAVPDATLSDTLPSCLSIVDKGGADYSSGQTLSWNLGQIAVGASACVTITVRAVSLGCP